MAEVTASSGGSTDSFLDLNSYFAAVEQELRPELRGRPVAVIPLVADTTCCIAASYEAKGYGVRTGTRVSEAKRPCPGIALVEARHAIYVEYHHRVVAAVESCIPVTSVMSIDEMACRLIGKEQPLLAALKLAREIKAAVCREAGATLRCSIGLAPNRYLAKVASGLAEKQRRTQLTAAMDRMNDKYGTNTLCFASMLLAGAAAPTRIAFSSIPELF